jgi:hypothetical protein
MKSFMATHVKSWLQGVSEIFGDGEIGTIV